MVGVQALRSEPPVRLVALALHVQVAVLIEMGMPPVADLSNRVFQDGDTSRGPLISELLRCRLEVGPSPLTA